MQVPAECLTSARQGRAADPRVIFTPSSPENNNLLGIVLFVTMSRQLLFDYK